MISIHDLLNRLWLDYASLNPQARAIHALLESQGEPIVNDHIALRTFGHPSIGRDALAWPFLRLGYQPKDEYLFVEKRLLARHYEHADPSLPKVFISELKLTEFSPRLQSAVMSLIQAISPDLPLREDFPAAGRPWNLSYATYESLRAESEYAAWVAAFGFRANHFTVLVNALRMFPTLQSLNAFLKENGFRLNDAGGEIKGSPEVMLEQSSTLADEVPVQFQDGVHTIPSCYYEFARRYPMPNGQLFQGFVEKSANRIFESTDKR